mgnify:CR=1 FL=1
MSKAATRWQVMKTAAGELGYVEKGGSTGRNGNITKYWEAHYPQWQGAAWCGAFVYWVLQKRGVKDVPLGKTGIFYTPAIVNSARAQGVWRAESQLSSAQPGDLVLFDFDGSGNAKHVGFVEKYLGNGLVQTIEGNTSGTNVGSQNDGGGVYRRVRGGATIMGFVDMSRWVARNAKDPDYKGYKGGTSTPSKPAAPKVDNTRAKWLKTPLKEHGDLSVGTIKRLQAEVNVTIDGQIGPQTRKAVQKWLGVTADGVWGPKTVKALQKKVGTKVDGQWGRATTTALQRHLNSKRR